MLELVADTSALVSLGIVAESDPDPLSICLERYVITVPEQVVSELEETASYDDEHGRAADAALERVDEATVRSITLDDGFPLDDGENAAVSLVNDAEADLLLCDEFNSLGLVHASLVDTRLLTTPSLLSVLVRADCLRPADAERYLDAISQARSWEDNSYVQRARSLIEE